MSELDLAAMCRTRGLPEPDRQVMMHTARGRVFLDVRWRTARLVVEVDGAHHGPGLGLVADQLRQNEVALHGEIVLRITVLGLRVAGEAFLDQVERALRLEGAA